MNIVAPTQFKKMFFSERRLVFIQAPGEKPDPESHVLRSTPRRTKDESSRSGEKPDEESDRIGLAGRLAERAFEDYLDKHPELREIFTAEYCNPENSLRERALKNLKEKAIEYIDTVNKNGKKFQSDITRQILELNAEVICRVLALESENSILNNQIDELESRNAELEVQSKTDSLTELPNRRAFLEHLKNGIEQDGPLHLLIIDLDQFKQVNDNDGHEAGNEVLQQIAICIQDAVREEDTIFVGRYGSGDEFVMLKNATEEDACKIAGRVSKAIKETPFTIAIKKKGFKDSTKTISLTASIGISTFKGKEEDPDGKTMINEADDCLYILKGKKPDTNNVCQERRGKIACNGEVLGKNPSFSLARLTRNNVSKTVEAGVA